MALKPDLNDPNYKELMKQYEKDPTPWTRPDLAMRANVSPPVRGPGHVYPGLKQNPGRGEAIERCRRRACAHFGLNPTAGGMAEKTRHIGEMLFLSANEDETKVDYNSDLARNLMQTAGLLS